VQFFVVVEYIGIEHEAAEFLAEYLQIIFRCNGVYTQKLFTAPAAYEIISPDASLYACADVPENCIANIVAVFIIESAEVMTPVQATYNDLVKSNISTNLVRTDDFMSYFNFEFYIPDNM